MISYSGIQAQDSSTDDGYNAQGRFGIRGGVTISKQSFDQGGLDEDPESKFGGDLAILANLPIGEGFFMIQPELHWLQKGYKISDATNGGDITSTLNYLELPVLLRLNFGETVKLFAFAGPSVGYLLGGKYENDTVSEDVKDIYNDLDFSAHIGAGIGFGALEIDVRYMAGLSDIADSPTISGVKNSSFGAGVTLKF
jgi:hypothetical protein